MSEHDNIPTRLSVMVMLLDEIRELNRNLKQFGQKKRSAEAQNKQSAPPKKRGPDIIELIQRRGGTITPRVLARASRRYAGQGVAKAALEELARAGHGRLEWRKPDSKGGQPAARFTLGMPPEQDAKEKAEK
jgi:hypothetical protein